MRIIVNSIITATSYGKFKINNKKSNTKNFYEFNEYKNCFYKEASKKFINFTLSLKTYLNSLIVN